MEFNGLAISENIGSLSTLLEIRDVMTYFKNAIRINSLILASRSVKKIKPNYVVLI